MSFILDALKKSETERQRADAPALYEMKMAPARQRVATWLIVLAALLVINIVVLSVVLLRGNRSGAPAAEANTPPTPAPAVVSPSAAPAPAASPPMLAPTPAPSGQSSAPDSATSAPAVANEDDVPAADSAGSDQVPTYEQVSAASGANLPELKLDLHAYASNPADRFVFLNGVNLKEGQTSPAGVRVEAITPDGAILSWHGTRFFLHSQ
jgi:general secretion pathway protein B